MTSEGFKNSSKSNKWYFEISSNDQINLVEINSIEGRLLKRENSFTNRLSLDINEFPSGIYIAKVIFANKKNRSKKNN
jgi:CTP:phosphocholine cytidylyltransferase-like protein